MGVFCGTNTPKPPIVIILFALMLSLSAQAQTVIVTNALPTPSADGLSFTNVAIQSWTGYQYEGNTGNSTALLGASVDIGTFTAGKLGALDYGLGTEMTLGTTGSAVQALSLRAELYKNLANAQISAFLGGGRDFNTPGWFGEFGVGLNYNLYRAQSWFTYVGTGINFRFQNGNKLDYLPVVRTGIAF